MKRQIFEVHKKVLGASVGGYVPMASGYPKVFDSHAAAYADNIEAAKIAATGALQLLGVKSVILLQLVICKQLF